MPIKKIRITECPYCGNREFTKGMQSHQGSVYYPDKIITSGHSVHHIICTRCGSIVRSYVYHPEQLEPYDPNE